MLPSPRERILSDCLDRKFLSSAGMKWIPRFCVLSKDQITFAKLIQADRFCQWVQMTDFHALNAENLREVFERHDKLNNG